VKCEVVIVHFALDSSLFLLLPICV